MASRRHRKRKRPETHPESPAESRNNIAGNEDADSADEPEEDESLAPGDPESAKEPSVEEPPRETGVSAAAEPEKQEEGGVAEAGHVLAEIKEPDKPHEPAEHAQSPADAAIARPPEIPAANEVKEAGTEISSETPPLPGPAVVEAASEAPPPTKADEIAVAEQKTTEEPLVEAKPEAVSAVVEAQQPAPVIEEKPEAAAKAEEPGESITKVEIVAGESAAVQIMAEPAPMIVDKPSTPVLEEEIGLEEEVPGPIGEETAVAAATSEAAVEEPTPAPAMVAHEPQPVAEVAAQEVAVPAPPPEVTVKTAAEAQPAAVEEKRLPPVLSFDSEVEALGQIIRGETLFDFIKPRIYRALNKGMDYPTVIGFYRIISRMLKEELLRKRRQLTTMESKLQDYRASADVLGTEFKITTVSEGESKKLREEIAKKDGEVREYEERVEKLRDDFKNLRNRIQKETEQNIERALADLLAKVLPFVDNFDRALKAAKESTNFEALKDGIEMVHKQILEILGREGVEPIKADGEEFNPRFHEAIVHESTDKYPEDTVIETLRRGYMYRNKLLRPATVRIAKKADGIVQTPVPIKEEIPPPMNNT